MGVSGTRPYVDDEETAVGPPSPTKAVLNQASEVSEYSPTASEPVVILRCDAGCSGLHVAGLDMDAQSLEYH